MRSALVACVFGAVVSACGYSCDVMGDDTFRIGVISGLTGAAAKWNTYQNMGMRLAAEEFEAEGMNISLVYEDSQTKGVQAVAAYNKLVDRVKVDALIADDFGLVIAPLLSLVKRRGTLLVSTGLPHDRFCQEGGDYFVSAGSKIEKTKAAFEDFFTRHPEVRRIGLVVFDDPDWGNAYRSVWESIAKERGLTIVETFLNNEWTPDFKSMLVKMMAKQPDAFLVAHEPESFIKALRQMKFQGQVVLANNVLEMVADTTASRPELDGVYTVDPIVSPEFTEKFCRAFQREPILEAYSGYEAVRVLVKAARVNRKELHRGVRSVSYDGVAGRMDFTGSSCIGNFAPWGLRRFDSGRLVVAPKAGE